MQNSEYPLPTGTLIGHYRVVRWLGEGGMAEVYEALSPDGERVALKVLRTPLMRRPEVAFRFRREAEILELIGGRHIPRLIGRGRDDAGRPYLVMQYIEGTALSELLVRGQTLELETALHVARQVCRALIRAHSHGFIHRDIKPENIILSGDLRRPSVTVLDFGISKEESLDFTRPGDVFGTPAYMPIEQALGQTVTTAVDVYAVGAVLREMVTGLPPYGSLDAGKTLAAILAGPPRPAEDHGLPAALAAVINTALARCPDDRFGSALELDDALAGLSTDAPRQDPEAASAWQADPTWDDETEGPATVRGRESKVTLMGVGQAIAAGLSWLTGWQGSLRRSA